MQLINHLLPIFLLAVAGANFLLAMHTNTDGAAESSASASTDTHIEPHHHNIDYDNEGTIGQCSGWKQRRTDGIPLCRHARTGQDVQIRLGNRKISPATHGHMSPYAARFVLALSEQKYPDLKLPKDLEGIELEIDYGFILYRIIQDWVKLSNRKGEKMVIVKIPKMENAPTEEEKDILKGIFIGGDKFRIEVQKNGNAEIKFQKKLSPGTMKFTADYYKNFRKKGQMVKAIYSYGYEQHRGFESENISLAESTFTINWAKLGIKEVEQLRAVEFTIYFNLDGDKRGPHSRSILFRDLDGESRSIPLRDLSNDTLEKLFVGGEATIHLKLSNIDYDTDIEIGAVPVTKPKTAFDTFKGLIKLG